MLRPSIEEIQCPVDGQPHTAVGPCHMHAHSVRTFQFGAPGQIDTCSLDQQGGVGSWSFQGADLPASESLRTIDLILLLSLERAGVARLVLLLACPEMFADSGALHLGTIMHRWLKLTCAVAREETLWHHQDFCSVDIKWAHLGLSCSNPAQRG